MSGSLEQWVNLFKIDNFVEDEITSEHRLGRFKVKVTLKNGEAEYLKVRLVAEGSDNIEYSDSEKRRNINFKLVKTQPIMTSGDAETELEQEFWLPAAGGNKYKIEAMYKGDVKATSKVIESRRKLFYQIITMRGLTIPSDFSGFEDEYWNEAKKYYIKLKNIGTAEIDRIENIGSRSDSNALKESAKAVYSGQDYDFGSAGSYCVAVIFTDHLAVKDAGKTLRWNYNGSISKTTNRNLTIRYASPGQAVGNHYLWRDLVTGEGPNISATFTDHTGAEHDVTSDISLGPVEVGSSGIKKLIFSPANLPDSFFEDASNSGFLSITFDAVNRMRAGLALGDNVIVICTRAWWRDTPSSKMLDVMVHELGHKIGMVSDGTGKKPDATSKQYTGQGHVGSHCSNGYSYDAGTSTWSNGAGDKCVMYGSTNGVRAFCGECEAPVRKADCDVKWSSIAD